MLSDLSFSWSNPQIAKYPTDVITPLKPQMCRQDCCLLFLFSLPLDIDISAEAEQIFTI